MRRIWFDTHLVYDLSGAGPVTPFEFGKNRTLWPSFTFEYWMRTRKFEPHKYEFEYRRGGSPA